MTIDSWREVKLQEVVRELVDRGRDQGLPVLSITKNHGIMLASERFGKEIHGRKLDKYRVAPRNSIALDPMLLWSGTIGRQKIVAEGLVSPDYRVYEVLDGALPEFLEYAFKGHQMASQFRAGARGTNVRRNRISRSDFMSRKLSLPPLSEQRKITEILRSVDEAIARTEAVIGEVLVVKKGLMQELLTRGLPDRHTRFKQTEIGEVPEEWDVVPVISVLKGPPKNGISPRAREIPPGRPTFSIAAVRAGRVSIDDNLKYIDLEDAKAEKYLLRRGDILVVRGNGNLDLMGRCGQVDVSPEGCVYPDILMRMSPAVGIVSKFLVYTWNSEIVHDQLAAKAKTTNGTHKINQKDVSSTFIPLPSIDEQKRIAEALDALSGYRETCKHKLEGLSVAKQALMSVLLTGEVRVQVEEEAA